jgi:Holliday junction resolvase RusA-like endonuclease
VRLVLEGHVPSKKNLLRRSKNGGMFRNREVSKYIDAITLQAKALWGGRAPLSKPRIEATFYCKDQRGDLDNKWTTVQDCLVAAGVIENDNLKSLPGPITFGGVVDKNERVVVEIV